MFRKIILSLVTIGLFAIPLQVSALSISPLRQALSIKPGQQKVVRIKAKNTSGSRQQFRLTVDSFTIDQNGNIRYSARDKAEDWIKYNRNPFILNPGEERTVTFQLSVPENAGSKSHYLTLFVEQMGAPSQVQVSSRVGSLLFVHVAGVRNETLRVEEFSTTKDIYLTDSIKGHLKLRNDGSIHVIPKGKVMLMKSGKVLEKKKLKRNGKKEMVLPGGKYYKSFEFDNISLDKIGKMSVVAYMRYGRANKPLASRVDFYYIPKEILITATALLTILFLLFLIKKEKYGS